MNELNILLENLLKIIQADNAVPDYFKSGMEKFLDAVGSAVTSLVNDNYQLTRDKERLEKEVKSLNRKLKKTEQNKEWQSAPEFYDNPNANLRNENN